MAVSFAIVNEGIYNTLLSLYADSSVAGSFPKISEGIYSTPLSLYASSFLAARIILRSERVDAIVTCGSS